MRSLNKKRIIKVMSTIPQRVAAITGAYRGLGAALSRVFAVKGYKLVLGSRDSEALEKFANKFRDKTEVALAVMNVRKKEYIAFKDYFKNHADSI